MTTAYRAFLPWVREGLAGQIEAVDPLSGALPARAAVAASVRLNGRAAVGTGFRLHGPGAVIGLDPRRVIRTDPAPGGTGFEPNHLALVELDRPDLPWAFTPAKGAAGGRLRPWLCLVVVDRAVGSVRSGRPLPVLTCPVAELPNLAESWAWAHAQAITGQSDPVDPLLDATPERGLARLVCARRLAPNTAYIACLVPTFERGRRAGLGLAISPAEEGASATTAPAWSFGAAGSVDLPVYHHWEFSTGALGD